MNFQNALHAKTTIVVIYTDRTGPDRVGTGLGTGHWARMGSWALVRAGPGRARQVRAGSGSAGQCRIGPNRTGRGHEASVSAEQGWARPWHVQQDRTGAKGAV